MKTLYFQICSLFRSKPAKIVIHHAFRSGTLWTCPVCTTTLPNARIKVSALVIMRSILSISHYRSLRTFNHILIECSRAHSLCCSKSQRGMVELERAEHDEMATKPYGTFEAQKLHTKSMHRTLLYCLSFMRRLELEEESEYRKEQLGSFYESFQLQTERVCTLQSNVVVALSLSLSLSQTNPTKCLLYVTPIPILMTLRDSPWFYYFFSGCKTFENPLNEKKNIDGVVFCIFSYQ